MRKAIRNQKGSFIVATAVAALMIILPLGLYAFEVARANLAACQLRSATDAAALAASNYLHKVDATNKIQQNKAKEIAFKFLQRNLCTAISLQNARISSSVQSDVPASGETSFDLVFNQDNSVTAIAAFGLQPAFSSFLGIKTLPIRVNSSAGAGGLDGDVVVVVDLSNSMAEDSHSVIFTRRTLRDGRVLHGIRPDERGNTDIRNTAAFREPHERLPDANIMVPHPDHVDFNRSELMKSLQNQSIKIKLAAMVEAKLGNLENAEIYESSGASKSALSEIGFVPGPGYQDDYQRLALSATQPLQDEKTALASFMQSVAGSDAHFSLVTFSDLASEGEHRIKLSDRAPFKLPQVDLSQGEANDSEIVKALEPATAMLYTNTSAALQRAVDMLKGPGHREGRSKTVIFLTDGRQTAGDPIDAACTAAKRAGIKVLTIGFFHGTPGERTQGAKELNALCAGCGNGSKNFTVENIEGLKNALKIISSGDPSLINR